MTTINTPKRWVLVACVLMLCGVAAGCSRASFTSSSDFQAVATIYDEEYDFTQGRETPTTVTYFMPEVVFDLSDQVEGGIEVGDKYDDLILETVASNLATFGYLRVADPADAEVEVEIGKVAQDNWAYYSGGWCCGWYWYYPSYGYYINYPSGTVIIGMSDPRQTDPAEMEKYIVWSAGMRGLLDYQSSNSVRNTIDQAFEQSADYLDIGDPAGPGDKPDPPDAGAEDGGM